MIGHNAREARTQGGGSATVIPERVVSPLDAIRAALPHASVELRARRGRAGRRRRAAARAPSPTRARESPACTATFLDADGAELFSEDRRVDRARVVRRRRPGRRRREDRAAHHLHARRRPGEILLGFAGANHGRLFVDGDLVRRRQADHRGHRPRRGVPQPAVADGRGRRRRRARPIDIRAEFILGGVDSPLTGVLQRDPRHRARRLRPRRPHRPRPPRPPPRPTSPSSSSARTPRSSPRATTATNLDLPGRQDDLVRAVVAANPRTVVIVNAGVAGGAAVGRRRRGDRCSATSAARSSAHAIADMLTGAAEPGGRLPTTWPAALADVPVLDVTPDGRRADLRRGHPHRLPRLAARGHRARVPVRPRPRLHRVDVGRRRGGCRRLRRHGRP